MQKDLSTLVVDDDEGVRFAVAALLTSIGHEVETASDVAQASISLKCRTPDVVVCDYMLGNQTSLALTESSDFERVQTRVLLTGHERRDLDPAVFERFTVVVEKRSGSQALIAAVLDAA